MAHMTDLQLEQRPSDIDILKQLGRLERRNLRRATVLVIRSAIVPDAFFPSLNVHQRVLEVSNDGFGRVDTFDQA